MDEQLKLNQLLNRNRPPEDRLPETQREWVAIKIKSVSDEIQHIQSDESLDPTIKEKLLETMNQELKLVTDLYKQLKADE